MDPVTATLVGTAVSFIASYLSKAGESAAQKAGQDIYQYLKARFGRKAEVTAAMQDLEKQPDDTDIQAAVRVQLRKLLQENSELASEIQRMVQSASSGQASVVHIHQKAGDEAMQFGQVFGNVDLNRQKR